MTQSEICILVLILSVLAIIMCDLCERKLRQKKYEKFVKELRIGDKFSAGMINNDDPFDKFYKYELIAEIQEIRFNDKKEPYVRIKYRDCSETTMSAKRLYHEFNKINE